MNDDAVLKDLRASWQAKHDEATALIGKADATKDDIDKATKAFDERDKIGEQIDARIAETKQLESLKARQAAGKEWASEPVRTLPFSGKQQDKSLETKGADGRIETGLSEIDKKEATGGFKSLGHFCWSVRKGGSDLRGESSAVTAIKEWEDLQRKAPSGMFEESDPDGGILVPRQFSNNIYQRMTETNALLPLLNPIPLTGNQITIPALKENSRANGSRNGGIQSYWIGEADPYIASRPLFRDLTLKLKKLTVLVYLTDELLNDSAIALQAWLMQKVPDELNFKLNDAVINGPGGALPKGILTSGSLITASAVSGQGANTFVFNNVLAMYSRVITSQRKSLVWLYNQDVEPQLFGLYLPAGTAGGAIIFTPNLSGDGFRLMGRPAIEVEQAPALGTAGDVIAFAIDSYVCATKGGIENFMSMHVRWLNDEQALKWRFRFDGQPYDDVPLTPFKGSNTKSGIVVLSGTRT
jgi:HK97 family phage major capsid protein